MSVKKRDLKDEEKKREEEQPAPSFTSNLEPELSVV